MRRPFTCAVLLLCALVLCACFGQIEDKHPNKVLTKRVALFKQFTRALEPIGLVVSGRREYKKDEFVEMVQELQTLAAKPWPYFTADGNYPPTHARSAVWDEPAAFKEAQEKYQSSVNDLLAVAAGGDMPAIKAAAEAVGERCKACHKHFRYE
jgi:cytochrome c556